MKPLNQVVTLKNARQNRQYFGNERSVESAEEAVNSMKLKKENQPKPTVAAVKGVCLKCSGSKLHDFKSAELI